MLTPIQYRILKYMSKPTFEKHPDNKTDLDCFTFQNQNKYHDVPNELTKKLHKKLYLIKSSLEALEKDKLMSSTYNSVTDDGRAAKYLYKEANRKKNAFQSITIVGIILGLLIAIIADYEAILKWFSSIFHSIIK